MPDADECFPCFGHEIGAIFGCIGDASSDHEGEAGHFASQFGDDAFGHGGADSGECAECFDILFFDGDSDFPDGPNHSSERLFHSDAIDGADLFEEFEFGIVHEADDAGCESSLLRVSFKEFDGAKADIAIEFGLKLSANDIRQKDFIVESTDAD